MFSVCHQDQLEKQNGYSDPIFIRNVYTCGQKMFSFIHTKY